MQGPAGDPGRSVDDRFACGQPFAEPAVTAGIVAAVGALWRRRTVRHVVVGLLPLLVVGTAVILVLVIRFGSLAVEVREATGRATATVERSALGPERREVELRWTDDRGVERRSTVRAAVAGHVPAGTTVDLRYVPGDPGRVYVNGDQTSAVLRDLAYGIPLVALLVAVSVLVTTVHVTRRLAVERRPATTMPVTYARSRRGLTSLPSPGPTAVGGVRDAARS